MAKIEDALKRDAALSFKLLRYINSAGFGLSCEIQSFRHAVAVLGYQNLYRWLALLMVTAARQSASLGTGDHRDHARSSRRVARRRACSTAQERDNLFIVGAFSLLDAIFKVPLDTIVEQIPLPEPVLDALFRHEGAYGPMLSIVEATESFDKPESRGKAVEMAGLLGITDGPAQSRAARGSRLGGKPRRAKRAQISAALRGLACGCALEKMKLAVHVVHYDSVLRSEAALENILRERILDLRLDRAVQRTRAVDRVEAHLGELGQRRIAHLAASCPCARETLLQIVELDLGDRLDVALVQCVEYHDFVDAVDELRAGNNF